MASADNGEFPSPKCCSDVAGDLLERLARTENEHDRRRLKKKLTDVFNDSDNREDMLGTVFLGFFNFFSGWGSLKYVLGQ